MRVSQGNAKEVFAAFTKLGLTSFGGPVAHIGYFRREFVERRRWVDDTEFARLLALCQFLPGPASSQTGKLAQRYQIGAAASPDHDLIAKMANVRNWPAEDNPSLANARRTSRAEPVGPLHASTDQGRYSSH